jgi:hypothetical protein
MSNEVKLCVGCGRPVRLVRGECGWCRGNGRCLSPAMEIISRAEARQRGLRFYFTGLPCKRRHLVPRYTVSRKCVECLRLHQSAIHRANPYRAGLENWFEPKIRAWREANPDLARAVVRTMIRARERREA